MLASSGYVAERPEVPANLETFALPPITKGELLYLLEYYCGPGLEVPSLSEGSCNKVVNWERTPAWWVLSLERTMVWLGTLGYDFGVILVWRDPNSSLVWQGLNSKYILYRVIYSHECRRMKL